MYVKGSDRRRLNTDTARAVRTLWVKRRAITPSEDRSQRLAVTQSKSEAGSGEMRMNGIMASTAMTIDRPTTTRRRSLPYVIVLAAPIVLSTKLYTGSTVSQRNRAKTPVAGAH